MTEQAMSPSSRSTAAAWFARVASRTATLAGHYVTFLLMLGLVLVWLISGPLFKFSESWQLVINTGTTIVTFLMVFLIQNSQNRDSMALHLKLDELIRSIDEADNAIIQAEEHPEEDLAELKRMYHELCDRIASPTTYQVGGAQSASKAGD